MKKFFFWGRFQSRCLLSCQGCVLQRYLVIGTATLAALIGAGGLGSFILLGIDRNNASLILIGAISSALLAIAFSTLLKWMEHAKLKTIFATFIVLFAGLGASFVSGMMPSMGQQTLIIAGKLGPEPEIFSKYV